MAGPQSEPAAWQDPTVAPLVEIQGVTKTFGSHYAVDGISLAYVAVIVQSRLVRLDPSLEEAAMDLGAYPWKVFFLVTLPLIAPALAAGWLLHRRAARAPSRA